MLAVQKPRRKRSSRNPFLAPLWDDEHPAFRRIDATLPADHHARWLVRVVSHLDLTALRLCYAGYGSLAYPVELLLAFVLFVYSKGILSPAQWARQARYDDQCKWLLRGLQPSRSLLYTFRDRTEPFVVAWHKQLLAWAVLEGLTSAKRGSLDGSFVAALASRHQLLSVRRVDRRLLLLRLLVWLEDAAEQADLAARLADLPDLLLGCALLWLALLGSGVVVPRLEETLVGLLALVELLNPEETLHWPLRLPAWVPQSAAGRHRVLQRYEHAQQRLTHKLLPYQDKKKLSKKDQQTIKNLKVSLSDPDAALGFDKVGTFRPLYNLLLMQDTETPLTLAWDLQGSNHDQGTLKPMVEKTKEQVGHYPEKVLVDGVFVTVGEVDWCEKQGIVLYAPPGKEEAGGPQGPAKEETGPAKEAAKEPGPAKEETGLAGPAKEAAKEAGPAKGQQQSKPAQLPKEQFRYVGQEKAYYCPQGKRLPELRRHTVKRKNGLELTVLVHQASGQDCQACPQRQGCTSNPAKGRVVKRYEGEEAVERLRQRMKEPASRQIYKLRKQSVELGYADLKEHRGLRIFRCFGEKRARAQAGLVILASDGLKLVHALQRRQQAPQPPPSPAAKHPA